MHVLGLHVLDILVLTVYIVGILWIGKKVGEKNIDTRNFFLAGRSLGKFFQFFLNFGTSTNADQAVAVTRETYRQGVGGMWIQFLVLFITPFYWFIALWYRRIRLTTVGDLFTERFQSRVLGGSYALFTLLMAFVGGGVGYMVAAKTMMAVTPKPAEVLTVEEERAVEQYREYLDLREIDYTDRTAEEQGRYEVLHQKQLRGEIVGFHSYTNRTFFYFLYGLMVAAYTMMGGFRGAAITDAVQGMLIAFFSVILVPLGLAQLGGFSGLHAEVPDFKFALFGSVTLSDYAWYTIIGMALSNLVSIVAVAMMMQTAGSARTENTARFGMIAGLFGKRFIMLFWVMAGLIAIGLYGLELHDPDLAWGMMTRDLLAPGLIGLMLVGILAANMSTLDTMAMSNSALFIRNLYQPFLGNKSERHYLWVGRLTIAVTLLGGIGAALYIDNLLELFRYFISIPAIFGAPIWLGFIWRRLTKVAVGVEIIICFTLFAIIPNLFMASDWARTYPAFLQQTESYVETYLTPATEEDVAEGRATHVGDAVEREVFIEARGIFFESVVRQDPADPDSPLIGTGRFEAELWVLSWFGIDFAQFQKSQLVALRFFFIATFPFVLLIGVSFLTRPVAKEHLDRFYAKIYTPVAATQEADDQAVEEAFRNPEMIRRKKLLPDSQWEIARPDRMDYIGFLGSWAVVGIVILCLWGMVSIGR